MTNEIAIGYIKSAMVSLKITHMIDQLDEDVTEEQRLEEAQEYKNRRKALIIAISALESLGRITAERDAAISELRSMKDNCFCCKWYNENAKQLTKCQSPKPCCVDGNPDRWEWRGVQNE